jgi:hypothetical protein
VSNSLRRGLITAQNGGLAHFSQTEANIRPGQKRIDAPIQLCYTSSPGFLAGSDMDLSYLCKFKGTLTPEQMREDVMLALAEDDQPYRQHIITR